MKEKILRLCKHLNMFSLDRIALISQFSIEELEPILQDLIQNGNLILKDGYYIYIEKDSVIKNNKLMYVIGNYPAENTEFLIRCFCAEIPVEKVSKVINLCENRVSIIFKSIREVIYQKQLQECELLISKSSQIPRERTFFNKSFYFYSFKSKYYIADRPLCSLDGRLFSASEAREFCKLYSKIKRKLAHNTMRYYTHFHIAEVIWRNGKNYTQLVNELCNLMNC